METSVNADKTKALIISTSSKDNNWNAELKAQDTPIDVTDKYKFLGVTIDNQLRFTDHTNRLIRKNKKRVNILKCMTWKTWGNSLETQRKLYLQYVRSCLEYGSSSWSPWIPNTKKKKLETVQNEALRSAAGLAKTCPVDFLRLETNVEPLADRYKKNDEILWDNPGKKMMKLGAFHLLKSAKMHVLPRSLQHPKSCACVITNEYLLTCVL